MVMAQTLFVQMFFQHSTDIPLTGNWDKHGSLPGILDQGFPILVGLKHTHRHTNWIHLDLLIQPAAP